VLIDTTVAGMGDITDVSPRPLPRGRPLAARSMRHTVPS
jgi:hypothetical protein